MGESTGINQFTAVNAKYRSLTSDLNTDALKMTQTVIHVKSVSDLDPSNNNFCHQYFFFVDNVPLLGYLW